MMLVHRKSASGTGMRWVLMNHVTCCKLYIDYCRLFHVIKFRHPLHIEHLLSFSLFILTELAESGLISSPTLMSEPISANIDLELGLVMSTFVLNFKMWFSILKQQNGLLVTYLCLGIDKVICSNRHINCPIRSKTWHKQLQILENKKQYILLCFFFSVLDLSHHTKEKNKNRKEKKKDKPWKRINHWKKYNMIDDLQGEEAKICLIHDHLCRIQPDWAEIPLNITTINKIYILFKRRKEIP